MWACRRFNNGLCCSMVIWLLACLPHSSGSGCACALPTARALRCLNLLSKIGCLLACLAPGSGCTCALPTAHASFCFYSVKRRLLLACPAPGSGCACALPSARALWCLNLYITAGCLLACLAPGPGCACALQSARAPARRGVARRPHCPAAAAAATTSQVEGAGRVSTPGGVSTPQGVFALEGYISAAMRPPQGPGRNG